MFTSIGNLKIDSEKYLSNLWLDLFKINLQNNKYKLWLDISSMIDLVIIDIDGGFAMTFSINNYFI
jgi:hypothetical protein